MSHADEFPIDPKVIELSARLGVLQNTVLDLARSLAILNPRDAGPYQSHVDMLHSSSVTIDESVELAYLDGKGPVAYIHRLRDPTWVPQLGTDIPTRFEPSHMSSNRADSNYTRIVNTFKSHFNNLVSLVNHPLVTTQDTPVFDPPDVGAFPFTGIYRKKGSSYSGWTPCIVLNVVTDYDTENCRTVVVWTEDEQLRCYVYVKLERTWIPCSAAYINMATFVTAYYEYVNKLGIVASPSITEVGFINGLCEQVDLADCLGEPKRTTEQGRVKLDRVDSVKSGARVGYFTACRYDSAENQSTPTTEPPTTFVVWKRGTYTVEVWFGTTLRLYLRQDTMQYGRAKVDHYEWAQLTTYAQNRLLEMIVADIKEVKAINMAERDLEHSEE